MVACTQAPTSARSPAGDGMGATIVKTGCVLLVLPGVDRDGLAPLLADFCGAVVRLTDPDRVPCLRGKAVYLSGQLSLAAGMTQLDDAARVLAIRQLCTGTPSKADWQVVDVGRVPLLVHGVGVYYRRFFASDSSYFQWVQDEHKFQTLTESTKPGTAHRTGIYLTPVEQRGEESHFRLLRCSTNFSGPTLGFGQSDSHIVGALNQEAASVFERQAPLNHVLAQIYHNTPAEGDRKQTKAKIKAHSDKTKDMPEGGLIAFVTFYDRDQLARMQPLDADGFDLGHRGVSGLTKLHFQLKRCVAERPGCALARQFSVTLYPDSVFLIPLSTNRLYTHEIRPPALDAGMVPTRMGYVVRCSNAEAVHTQGSTFFKSAAGELAPLEPATGEGMRHLKALYAEENSCDSIVDYQKFGRLNFSMNWGDYMRPVAQDDFRVIALSDVQGDPFEDLTASLLLESVGKGREGTVLVKPEPARGVPIVRTTTQYSSPAQCFKPVHSSLAERIQNQAKLPAGFNNALFERYSNAYATMGLHSDQDLDLQAGTHIAVYSCYRRPELPPARVLVVESKEAGGPRFEIQLAHNSAVVWSLEANRRYRHKIVLSERGRDRENQWVGVTFRTSKTFVHARGGRTCLEDGSPLTLAGEEQRREFFSLRGRENKGTDFSYPRLSYTISESDLVPPVA